MDSGCQKSQMRRTPYESRLWDKSGGKETVWRVTTEGVMRSDSGE